MSERWVELVVTGAHGEALPFVHGWLAARGAVGPVFDAEDEGVDIASLRERVAEMIGKRETSHLLTGGASAPLVREALASDEARRLGLALTGERPLAGAAFEFHIRTQSQGQFQRLRQLLTRPPAGARLADGAQFTEKRHDEGAEQGVYAPVTPYEGRGRGRIEGEIPAVLQLWRACQVEELVNTGAPVLFEDSAS